MPRKAKRGGARQGSPGTTYTNRTDLNVNKTLPPKAVPGQTYGEAGAQLAAQRAIPLPNNAAPAPMPGDGGDFLRPTERPGEPVTAGLPVGAGPGPEALTTFGAGDITRQRLLAIYQRYPSEGLLAIIENLDD